MNENQFSMPFFVEEYLLLKKQQTKINKHLFNDKGPKLTETEKIFEEYISSPEPKRIMEALEIFLQKVAECSAFVQKDLNQFIFPLFIHFASSLIIRGYEFYFSNFINSYKTNLTHYQNEILQNLIENPRAFKLPSTDISISKYSAFKLQKILEDDKLSYAFIIITEKIRYTIAEDTFNIQNTNVNQSQAKINDEKEKIRLFELFNPGSIYTAKNRDTMQQKDIQQTYIHDMSHITLFNHHNNLSCIKLSPCGRLLGYAEANSVRLFILDKEHRFYFPNKTSTTILNQHSKRVTNFAFSANSAMVVSGGMDNEIRIAHTEAASQVGRYDFHTKPISNVTFYDDTFLFFGGSFDGTISMWEMSHHLPIRLFAGHTSTVTCLSSKNRQTFVSSSLDGTVRIWDVGEGRELNKIELNDTPVSLDTTENGRMICVGMTKGFALLSFDGDILHESKTDSPVNDIKFSSNELSFITACEDGIVSIYDINGSKQTSVKPDSTTSDSIQVLNDDSIVICGRSYKV
ncbi:hypothetical protein TVAG_058450 [Trichomonas vaginalis G3]|uniref:Uncharacterized protein n=1 Tax=Trichomonas vaginalis (strain ATCC PRA-98 / G3) TaxID=412133 RepID=A2EQA5_TRIV3|nr:transcription initiation from RNA polymerase II promoter [Trichomonas vaginalis G3]EAY05188.1 hypothetical protein TVAG_058450 [Trichomonas vaginalis G3]KAI5522958.1 transcription initiation from RNA polymerase II promoter [Trichomonas vaginalis G3]|eukprot:XP_001317411.1 hypothetical protein [Trichomonas vaginalis G3]